MACLPNLYKPLLFLLIIFASTAFSSKNITIHEDKIVFGAGCFWSVEKKFAELPGVINVESGYADGIGLEPRYSEITKFKNKFNPDNFAEVVQVTYDRNSISLTDLIKFFFELHDPTQKNRQGNDIGTQYRCHQHNRILRLSPLVILQIFSQYSKNNLLQKQFCLHEWLYFLKKKP